MTKLFIYIFLLFNSVLFAQNQQIFDSLLVNKLRIVSEEKLISEIDANEIFTFGNLTDLFDSKFDSVQLVHLINKHNSIYKKSKKWAQGDFKNVYFLKEGEKVNMNAYLKVDTISKKKEVRKKINIYNQHSGWTNIPLKISHITYSDDNQFALVKVINGNNGSNVILFQNLNNNWKIKSYLMRLAF